MAEGLREVAEKFAAGGSTCSAKRPRVVAYPAARSSVRRARSTCPVSEGVGEPEGAQQEGALGFVESVVPAASVQQATFVAEPLLDRVDSREQPRVGARQEAHDGEQQDPGVQLVRAERLGVRAGRIAPSSGSPLGARRDRRATRRPCRHRGGVPLPARCPGPAPPSTSACCAGTAGHFRGPLAAALGRMCCSTSPVCTSLP